MSYYVCIMTNSRTTTLYIGMTNDLERRAFEQKRKLFEGFTKRYNLDRLVYFEDTDEVHSALAREKQLKGWLRGKKLALITKSNPDWKDLSAPWYE